MPKGVALLPRDKRGYPVPWAALWEDGPDPDHRNAIRRTQHGLTLWCSCVIGHGIPLLGQLCPRRQRRAMLERRCQLCGRLVKVTTKVVFIGGSKFDKGHQRYVTEPPLHTACASYAARVCPRLVVGDRSGALRVAECQAYTLFEERVRPRNLNAAEELLTSILPYPASPHARHGSALQNVLAEPHAAWQPFDQWYNALQSQ